MVGAIDVVEGLEPTTYAAVSLAELYSEAERWDDVVGLTEGIENEEDPPPCSVSSAARPSAPGYHDAAHEALKEALRSRSRAAPIRHHALHERSLRLPRPRKEGDGPKRPGTHPRRRLHRRRYPRPTRPARLTWLRTRKTMIAPTQRHATHLLLGSGSYRACHGVRSSRGQSKDSHRREPAALQRGDDADHARQATSTSKDPTRRRLPKSNRRHPAAPTG